MTSAILFKILDFKVLIIYVRQKGNAPMPAKNFLLPGRRLR